jgi:hypothetical protein
MTGKPGDCYAGFAPYRKHRSSIISTIPFLTPWHPTYFSADAEVCEIILGDKRRFVKDVKEVGSLHVFPEDFNFNLHLLLVHTSFILRTKRYWD